VGDGLTFDDFRRMATDDALSPYEKIGFPDSYRAGTEAAICADILAKLPALARGGGRFLDIGPGCSDLPRMLIEQCASAGCEAVLVDSPEMLAHLPDAPHVVKLPGAFPETAPEGPFDAILAYSVLQYAPDADAFLDRALALLGDGGALLLGDLPNVSKRSRFFASAAVEAPPAVPATIDDDVVLGLLARARQAGCDAYVVPLRADLPLANRREDVVVVRP
jgi:trans-aconitate methyltransferase